MEKMYLLPGFSPRGPDMKRGSIRTHPMKIALLILIAFAGSRVLLAGNPTNGLFEAVPGLMSPARLMLGGQAVATKTNVHTELPAVGAVSISSYVPDDKYKLRIGDKVSFQILEDRDAPHALMLADSGEMDVPYLGRISAADKTCKQLAGELKALLEKEYYYRASIVLALDTANRVAGRVYVWGQVRNQGPFELAMNENLTAGKAVLRAGGFADFASKKKVKVIRPGTNGGAKQVFQLNMVEILENGQTEKDLLLQPEDSVIVGSRLINF